MGTNCAPLVADLFLFCYERDFMKSPTKEKRYDMIDAFNSTSRYPYDLLNKANASDTEAAFLDLNLSVHNDTVSTKIYDNRDDFDLTLFIFRSLMAMSLDVPLMVYIYINLFALPDHLRMLLNLSKAIGIINSAKHFPNFIVGTLNWSKNIMSVRKTYATRYL